MMLKHFLKILVSSFESRQLLVLENLCAYHLFHPPWNLMTKSKLSPNSITIAYR